MVQISPDKGVYQIGIAANLAGVSVAALRQYEGAGLLKPARTQGNTRLYSAQDIEQAKRIRYLVVEKGVNLPGVKYILQLEDKYGRDITGQIE